MKNLSDTYYGNNSSGKRKYLNLNLNINDILSRLKVYDKEIYKLADIIKINRIYISIKLRGIKKSKIRYEELHHWKKRYSNNVRDRRKYKEQRERILRYARRRKNKGEGEEVKNM